jgi:hypothetical protein
VQGAAGPQVKPVPSAQEQVDIIIRLLRGKTLSKDSPIWQRCLEWLVSDALKSLGCNAHRDLLEAICTSFQVTEQEIYSTITGVKPISRIVKQVDDEADLLAILPKGGWFEWYAEYTAKTESPLSYHIFSSLVALGSAIGRRAYLNMGFYRLYPNYCAVLIGPTGRVKKTSAVNIAKNIIEKCSLAPIMADKLTPEALAGALKESGQQFIYAPEFSVFFGKQKYNEGLTTLIIRLLDCPDKFVVRTMGRGAEEVENVALSVLGGSTLSLLSTGSASDVTSSGFLNRFVLVVENDTARSFPVPEKGAEALEAKILAQATRLQSFIGEFQLSADALSFYQHWYVERKRYLRRIADEITAEVLERTPDHLLRTAMLIHSVQCDNMTICQSCLVHASNLLLHIEKKIPQTVTAISQTSAQADTEYIKETINRLGGSIDHSKILRRVSHRMDASTFKRHIKTLIESGIIRAEKKGALQFYVVVE